MKIETASTLNKISVLGFLLSLIAQILTFTGWNPIEDISGFWFLQVGIVIVIFPAVLGLRRRNYRETFKYIQRWKLYFCAFLFFYFLTNMMIAMFKQGGGINDIIDGKLVLFNHGRIIKELTLDDWQRQEVYDTRDMTAFWMLCYFITSSIFMAMKKEDETKKIKPAIGNTK